MPISIFEDVEKKIPEWKEIFIGQDTQDHELKIVLKNSDFTQELPVLVSDGMDSAIKKLQYQIIKNFSSGNSFHLDLVNFLETNLFGKISLKEKVSNTFWINKEKSFSERETELLQFLVSELLLLVKKYKGSLEKEILEIAIASLLNEGKISEVLEISSAISLNNSISTKLSLFMYLIGESKELDLGNMEEDSILFALCELKQSRISETKKEALYDTVISGNSQNLIGVVYNLYSKKISGIRNALPLFQIVLKKYSNLTIPEKKIFIDDYLAFGFYFRSFFLMKKVYSTGEIKQKLANLNYINGKKKHPEPSQPKEDSIPL
ncbi:MAG: hypothetical protein HUU45_05600, partial [Leptospiraceae bacterium]|nr:hypothetical protein [Leptospiraceae bacterium]